jgi:predicted RNase H-like nuclease (RuvC/YqgF family)
MPAGDEIAEPTAESIQREIDELGRQMEAKQSQLASLQQKFELDAAAEQALQAKKAKLAAMQKETEARLLEQEALRAEIESAGFA